MDLLGNQILTNLDKYLIKGNKYRYTLLTSNFPHIIKIPIIQAVSKTGEFPQNQTY